MDTDSKSQIMPGKPDPRFHVVDYHSLNYGLDQRDLPSFKELLALSPTPTRSLSQNEREVIRRNWRPFEVICEKAGYDLVAGELNLLSDERLLSASEVPHFNTFLFFYGNPSNSMQAAYLRTLQEMQARFEAPDWIVWHESLYNGSHPLVTFQLASFSNQEHPALNVPAQSVRPSPLIDFSELDFKKWTELQRQIAGSTTILLDQIATFANLLLTHSAGTAQLLALWKESTVLIVPFMRPGSTLSERTLLSRTGGVVFLFVKARKDSALKTPTQLGQRISFLLTHALLSESFFAIELDAERQRVFSSMVHGTVTAIRSIRTTDLSSALSYSTPPKSAADLRVTLVDPETGVPNTSLADIVVRALQNAILCEDSAAALLSFSEINLHSSRIRRKFLNQDERSLLQILEEAFLMANHPTGRNHRLLLDLDEASSELQHWTIPKDYLDSKLIRGVIGELLRNAAVHGRPEANDSVVLRVECSQPSSDSVSLHFYNPIVKGKENVTSGFLERTKMALNSLEQPIQLDFQTSQTMFSVTFTLGPLCVETGQGGRTVALRRV